MHRMRSRSVLVTGASGFVGSHLVRRLVDEGATVHIVVRPESNLEQLQRVQRHVVAHRLDGTTEGLASIVAESSPEIVFHLASLFVSEHRPADIRPLIGSNLLFGSQLLEAMKAVGASRLVNTGTSWQHYRNEAYSPVNLYAATKHAFEILLQYYLETSELQAVTLKLFDTYGPDDPRPKLMHLLDRISESGETLAMSPGEQLIDLVHIDDVVDAYLGAAQRLLDGLGGEHERYAVSSGKPLPLKELARLVGEALGKELNIEWSGRPYREREVMVPWDRGDTLPGWRPTIGLAEGVRSLFSGRHQGSPTQP